jgi:formate hydrogenlyase transcriptional activator
MRQCSEEMSPRMTGMGPAVGLDDAASHPARVDESSEMVGESLAMREVARQIEVVASTDATVLVLGETGTGKELVARAVHASSARNGGPLVTLNCAALQPNLVESELFGHERGAFTGALGRRSGRFELAHRSSIFLDEIGELPIAVQPKLLRLLQERRFERLGGSRTLHCDVRIIAATHRDLAEMTRDGSFREDLFYRLNVFPIVLPPLRERSADIPLLARHFLARLARRAGRRPPELTEHALGALQSYPWPGNIRQLENVLERAFILGKGAELDVVPPVAPSAARARPSGAPPPVASLEEIARAHIVSVLSSTRGVVGGPCGAAARLGMKRSTLVFRLKKLGISHVARKRSASSEPDTGTEHFGAK